MSYSNSCRRFQEDKQSFQTVASENKEESHIEIDQGSESAAQPPLSITLRSLSHQHSKCCICSSKGELHVISEKARMQILAHTRVFIPAGCRCCGHHLLPDKTFTWRELVTLKNSRETLAERDVPLSVSLLSSLLETTEVICNAKKTIDFDDDTTIQNDHFYSLTGLTKDQFSIVFHSINEQYLRNSPTISRRNALGMFLMKLRLGQSNSVLAAHFNLTGSRTVGRVLERVATALKKCFVPLYVGVQHISREDFNSQHVPNYCRTLMKTETDKVIVVVDGTYSYIQKALNNYFQKKSFSIHKKRSLVKPMFIVAPDGYILHVIPHYLSDSKNNDAAIIQHAFATNEQLRGWFQPGDTFVVDRGYLDAKEYLESEEFLFKMPSFLPKGAKQLPTPDANHSRVVTKVRFVVEVVNRRWREWQFFQRTTHNQNYRHLNDYTVIACAFINAFRPRIVHDTNHRIEIAQRIVSKLSEQDANALQTEVELDGLNRQQRAFVPVNPYEELQDFPQLSLRDIENHITLGPFQVKQARWYIAESVIENGEYKMHYHREKVGLIRARIQSRHTSSALYFVWVRYTPNENGPGSIKHWYCQCKAGTRTVGCCSHVAAVICFLGFYRLHTEEIPVQRPYAYFLNAGETDVTQT
jgi:hypothetical protein